MFVFMEGLLEGDYGCSRSSLDKNEEHCEMGDYFMGLCCRNIM